MAIRAVGSTVGHESSRISESFVIFNLQMTLVLSTFPEDCGGKGTVVPE